MTALFSGGISPQVATTPEGSIIAPVGTIVTADDKSIWLKNTGTGNTGWRVLVDIVAYTTHAALRAVTVVPADNALIVTYGALTAHDTGGGVWRWDATSTLADDDAEVIKLTSVATGRFLRVTGGLSSTSTPVSVFNAADAFLVNAIEVRMFSAGVQVGAATYFTENLVTGAWDPYTLPVGAYATAFPAGLNITRFSTVKTSGFTAQSGALALGSINTFEATPDTTFDNSGSTSAMEVVGLLFCEFWCNNPIGAVSTAPTWYPEVSYDAGATWNPLLASGADDIEWWAPTTTVNRNVSYSSPFNFTVAAGATTSARFRAAFRTYGTAIAAGTIIRSPEAIRFEGIRWNVGGSNLGAKGWKAQAAATYDPPSIAAGGRTSTTVSVPGAALGDAVPFVSFSLDTQGVVLNARVSSAGTVTVDLSNPTAGAIDLGSGTLRVKVMSA